MTITNGPLITQVEPGGIGAELELEPGDRLLAINGIKPVDFIDYLMLSSEEQVVLKVLKKSGELLELEFEKDANESLGFGFEEVVFDGIKTCNNQCLFCFVDQLPAGQRASLYIRDDDYRLSFLQGSYITLTNLTEADWQRIEKLRLSPLYISVHATIPEVRQKLMGSKTAGAILDQIRRLTGAGITLHSQAVICPGINDGLVLEKTITELAAFWPQVATLAVVPVGLTAHRRRIFKLRRPDQSEARQVLETVQRYQKEYLNKFGSRFVFAADEWHILAGEPFPPDEEYEGYPQLDNGVGLSRRFLSELDENLALIAPRLRQIRNKIVVITGESAIRLWEEVKDRFHSNLPWLQLDLLPVRNRFFGSSVTVTGLLTGNDLIQAIRNHPDIEGQIYLIPEITLKQGDALFLDGVSATELIKACLPKKVEFVPNQAAKWLEWITDKGSVAFGATGDCRCRQA